MTPNDMNDKINTAKVFLREYEKDKRIEDLTEVVKNLLDCIVILNNNQGANK